MTGRGAAKLGGDDGAASISESEAGSIAISTRQFDRGDGGARSDVAL